MVRKNMILFTETSACAPNWLYTVPCSEAVKIPRVTCLESKPTLPLPCDRMTKVQLR